MKVLITGGAGYIGSTIASALEDSGHTPIILDSLVTGPKAFVRDHIFYQGDIADKAVLKQIFQEHPDVFATIHCAALIVVPDSVSDPYNYYVDNVVKSMELFKNLAELNHPRVVFSSSASIYDVVPDFIVNEESPLKPLSPYARTKYMMEMILKDFCEAYGLKGIALRYFNPIGADPKMRTGLHVKNPSHLIGKLVQVALGKEPVFQLTGVNWPTRDGSGIRDYLHVWDLAQAHLKAVLNFDKAIEEGKSDDVDYTVINLGSQQGVTVKEFVNDFETVIGKNIPVEIKPARPGDIAGAYANAEKAYRLLGWKVEKTTADGIRDALRWGEIRDQILE